MDKVEKLRRNEAGADLDPVIPCEEIGKYLKAAGMKPTHQELLTALRDCNVEDGVKFSVLEKWLKKQVMSSKSKTRNPLLVNRVVGKTTATSYDLMGENHVYGVKIKRDREHGADVIFNWDSSRATRDANSDMYVDRVKMNKDAVKRGCTTAKEFVDHSQTQRRYTSLKKKMDTNRGQPLQVDVTRTFGRTKATRAAPIGNLLQSSYNTSVMDADTDYVVSSGSEKSKRQARQTRKNMRTTKMTKAQRLRALMVKKTLNPPVVEKFTMKQFKRVKSRLTSTGRNIVSA